ncbi:sulfurtransferase [Luteimonas sp. RD2P54]|uniref:Sulfurtransferase n=1 Tax=Luteimonas endophytica TaxID=3042023 RepID=A0ABT6JAT2_9GAMM|nr:sulfurtransferase [Luteimonas endophytica]MDH5823937.1 sulfurtransferase [Luteimonas endophytica]
MLTNVAAYRFTVIADPPALAEQVRGWAGAGGLRGTVLLAEEGINLFLAGTGAAVAAFMRRLRAEPGLDRLQAKYSHSRAQPFARLKVKVKPEIISFRRAQSAPLARRAQAVEPAALARWIANGADDGGRRLVLLDTRNREEVGYGTFEGALTLPIDNFSDLPAALAPHRGTLADATVVNFCTGGIRCEKAALWMRDAGIGNVLQLEGGILGYFAQVGGFGYRGECFVFDGRVALDPALRPRVDAAPALEAA